MKAKTRHFPITDFGGRGGLNVPFNLSKIVEVVKYSSNLPEKEHKGLAKDTDSVLLSSV